MILIRTKHHLPQWQLCSLILLILLFHSGCIDGGDVKQKAESNLAASAESTQIDDEIRESALNTNQENASTITAMRPSIPGLSVPLRATTYEPNSTFFSEEEDLKLIGEVFNAVLVSDWYVRERQWAPIQKIIDAGLVPIIRFDKAKFLFRGDTVEVQKSTDDVISGVKAAPFPLKFIKVADELNYGRTEKEELQTIEDMVFYLNMTARRFKEAGLVTLVDATSPELYGRPTYRKTYTIAGMNAIIASGLVDGVQMGNPGHRQGDDAVTAQWKNARKLWPNMPFFSRSASFSFTDNTFDESGKDANDLIRWAIQVPDSLGSAGWHLWAWRRENNDGTVYHILDANGQSNEAWETLVKMVNAPAMK